MNIEIQQSSTRDFAFLDSGSFAAKDYSCRWLVNQILVNRQPMVIGGAKKTLKTSLVVDMAISLGSGKPFLGRFAVPRPVGAAVLSGESGPAIIQETARRVAKAKRVRLSDCKVHWSFQLPRLQLDNDLTALKDVLRQEQISVVFIDPLYLCFLAGGHNVSAANLYEMGPILRQAGRACMSAGTTPVLVHHTVKRSAAKGELDLDDLAFSGIGEYARQWLLISRREQFHAGSGRHRLLLEGGGSAGHSGRWQLNVDEGILKDDFSGRNWNVHVSDVVDEDLDVAPPRRRRISY